jgi:alkylation response protein AidB-like acyl-CoA dehydrogenase
MHLLPTADQVSIRQSAAGALAEMFGPSFAHDAAAGSTRTDDRSWRALAEMGWFGLALPEEVGGAGLSAVEEAMVFLEAGRALAPLSLMGTVLGVHAAHLAGNAGVRDRLLGGESRAALVRPGAEGLWVALDAAEGGYALAVAAQSVELVPFVGDPGPVIDLIDPATKGVRWAPSVGRTDGAVVPAHSTLGLIARYELLVAAYLVGVGTAMLNVAVEYAKTREAFGRPIGSFQAIKHRLATVAMNLEAADAQVAYASVSMAEQRASSALEVEAARHLALKSALDASGAAIQTHGALGVTWEFDAHLYLTRARLLEHLPASPRIGLAHLATAGTK